MPEHHLDPNSPQDHLQPNSFYHHFLSVEAADPMQGITEYLKKLILGFNAAEFEGLKQQILLLSEQYEQLDVSELKALSAEVESQLNALPDHFHYNTVELERLKQQILHFSERYEQINSSALKRLSTEIQSQFNALEDQLHDPGYLTELMVPCITDTLNRRIQQSKTEVIQALLPIIDELVRLKAQQNRQQMSQAIATLIPLAIQHQIQTSPQEMAQAIAPEMGAAIQEQIRLDKDEIIKALAPTMGKTIQEQIILERDAMVDALYPVIGSTITRYLAEALREINQKIETALSIQGVQRKIKAKMQGVSEAELILAEAMHAQVQAVLLIHKASGLLITEIQQEGESRLDSDMLAGMLTAIRSFVNDCITNGQTSRELNEIEYGDSRILIEVAGYCYLAVIMQGQPHPRFIQKIRQTLSKIIQNHSQIIQDFDGNQESIPVGVRQQLQPLILPDNRPPKRQTPMLLILLVLLLLGLVFVPWQMAEARRRENHQAKTKALAALTTEPELALYDVNIDAATADQTLTLSGTVPNQRLRQQAETILQQTLPNWHLDNHIITVKGPVNPEQVEAEVQQMTATLNQMNGISISTEYNPPKVRLEGTVIQSEDIEKVRQAFAGIQGIEAVNSQLTTQPFPIATRIYFNFNSSKIIQRDFKEKIRLISQYLKKYPQLRVELIGYKDRRETGSSQNIGLKRSQAVQTALESYGIDRRRIETKQAVGIPPGVSQNQRQWLNRTVMIEIIHEDSHR